MSELTHNGLLQCAVHLTAFEDHSETTTGSECNAAGVMDMSRARVMPLFCNLHWLLVLVMTYKALYNLRLGYLENHLSLIVSDRLVRLDIVGML